MIKKHIDKIILDDQTVKKLDGAGAYIGSILTLLSKP